MELPEGVLYDIGGFLPPISKACLALSCKRLHSVYAKALESPDIHFPKTFQQHGRIRKHFDSLRSERWQFLRYLENRHWRCCSFCLKLHRVTEFSRKELDRVAEKRGCNMGRWAGIVELCPCIRLTFRDKLKLVEQLRLDSHRPRGLADLDLSAGSPHEFHSCTIPGPQIIFTRIFLVLDEGDLKVVTTYEATCLDESDQWGKILPTRLICPHLGATTYVREMNWARFQPNSQDTVSYEKARIAISCYWCGAGIGDFRAQYTKDKRTAKACFKTTRNLGISSQTPTYDWFSQTIYCQDPPIDDEGWDADPNERLHRFQTKTYFDWN